MATAAKVTGCTVPTALPMGRSPAGADWATSPATQAVVDDLSATLEQTFGPAGGKRAGSQQLARGLIGITMDHASRKVVVVVDPALADRRALDTDLARVTGAASRQAADADLAVEVRSACFAARDLLQAREVLVGRRWHPDARATAYAFYLDAADSRFHVSFSPSPAGRAVAAALERRLGERVVVEFDAPTLFAGTRGDDANPHFGGAFITPGFVDRALGCSSGFTVNFADGRRGMVTARHCFDLAHNFEPGLPLFSGIEEFAEVDGLELSFPAFDMMRITQPGQTYANVLHTDPCCPSQRTVTGKGAPVQNELLCVSGQLTGARCSVKVINPSGSFCPTLAEAPDWGGQCTHDVLIAERAGVQVAKKGDSGAPVYLPLAGNTASIRGILIGGNAAGSRIFAEKVNNIEQFLQVTVATF